MPEPVVIAGAGPTGLAVACGLLQHGVPVRVLEKADGPSVTSRANFLHARGSEVLDRLDGLGDLPERSVRAMKITTYLGDKPVMRIRFGDPGLRTAAPPMVISQAEVEAALRERLRTLGGSIEWGNPLVGLDQSEAGVVAMLGDGATVRADWLVGCDGAGSLTRRCTGIDFPGVKLTERFLLADVRLDWDVERSGTTGWLSPSGMIGAMPMPGGLWRIIAYDPGQPDEKPSDDQILERLARILPERTARRVNVTSAEWLSLFSVHRRLAETYRHGRVLIAGDAAHTHAPFGGQGMLTGLGDAENLAWKLALVTTGRAAEALLDTYEPERRPLATEVLRNTSAVTKLNIASGPVGRFVRDQIATRIFNLGAVQRWATHQTSQLWVSYRRGPLAERSFTFRRPRPGDRVPDQRCDLPDGGSSRLYVELRGRWALLGSADDPALADTARGWLGERVVVLGSGEHSRSDTMLIRPDGHLGWRGSSADGLARWLRSMLAGDVR